MDRRSHIGFGGGRSHRSGGASLAAVAMAVVLACSGSKVDKVTGSSGGNDADGGADDARADGQPQSDAATTRDTGCGLSCAVGFEKDVMPVLVAAKCASRGCHGAGDAQPRLDDRSASALYESLLTAQIGGKPYVVGCSAGAQSQMLCNLQGDPSCGKAMPLGGPPIGAEGLRTIGTWLDCGAPPP
ncbi:MAG: hypothetical protein HOO96_39045 [Polyangiaceae bacterium]|nr:hypothetical protein [Polyangiaceae bacterium]